MKETRQTGKQLTAATGILTFLQSHVSGAVHDVSDGPAAR